MTREPEAADEASRAEPAARLAHMRAVFFDLDGCLWFGDTLASDIAGGNLAGMVTVRVGDNDASAMLPAPVADYELADVRGLARLLWGGVAEESG